MAGETEDHSDTDHPRRPGQPSDGPGGGFVIRLPDGRRVILAGAGFQTGTWYVRGDDGWPDWDQPVDIHKELNIEAARRPRTLKQDDSREPPGSDWSRWKLLTRGPGSLMNWTASRCGAPACRGVITGVPTK